MDQASQFSSSSPIWKFVADKWKIAESANVLQVDEAKFENDSEMVDSKLKLATMNVLFDQWKGKLYKCVIVQENDG